MRMTLLLLCMYLSGCARYTEAQINLIDQARRGMELCRSAHKERSAVLEQYHRTQRQRLDEAFAADVRAARELSAEWVLEHQKAYAAAIEVLDKQRVASAEADAAANRNFDAVDEALRRVQAIMGVEMKLSIDGLVK